MALLIILLISELACSSSGSTTYQLTTVTFGQGNVSPNSGVFATGSTVTLTAIPASGWEFGYWQGDFSENG
jgi:hypothetical protein